MTSRSFFNNPRCLSRKACRKCRNSESYREKIASLFDVPSVNFDCPYVPVVPDTIYEDVEKEISADGNNYMRQFLAQHIKLVENNDTMNEQEKNKRRERVIATWNMAKSSLRA